MLQTRDGAIITPPDLKEMTLAEMIDYQVRIKQEKQRWADSLDRSRFGPIQNRANYHYKVFELEEDRLVAAICSRTNNVKPFRRVN